MVEHHYQWGYVQSAAAAAASAAASAAWVTGWQVERERLRRRAGAPHFPCEKSFHSCEKLLQCIFRRRPVPCTATQPALPSDQREREQRCQSTSITQLSIGVSPQAWCDVRGVIGRGRICSVLPKHPVPVPCCHSIL